MSLVWSVLWAVVCCHMADKRGRSQLGWAIGGAVFGLLAVLVLLLIGKKR